MQFSGFPNQSVGLHSQAFRQKKKRCQTRLALGPLQQRYRGRMQAGTLRQHLMREPAFLPKAQQHVGECIRRIQGCILLRS